MPWLLLAAYPNQALRIYVGNTRFRCPWKQTPWLQEKLGACEPLYPQLPYADPKVAFRWPNTEHGRLLDIICLLEVEQGETYGAGSAWGPEARALHRHYLKSPDAFSVTVRSAWEMQERVEVFTKQSDDGASESIASRHTTVFTPMDLDYDALAVAHGSSDEPVPLLEVTKGQRDLKTVLVPEAVAAGILAGSWTNIVLLARHLPGAQNRKRRRFVKRYKPLLADFPQMAWVWEVMAKVRDPVPRVEQPCRPFSVARCLDLASHLKRWQSLITSSLHDPDEINGEVCHTMSPQRCCGGLAGMGG